MQIRDAFGREFYNGNGVYANGTQTAQACAIYHKLSDSKDNALVLEKLLAVIRQNGQCIDTGIFGTIALLESLHEYDFDELAYQMITNPDGNSYASWINKGATTLWEDWEGLYSHNHIMFGHVSAWFL